MSDVPAADSGLPPKPDDLPVERSVPIQSKAGPTCLNCQTPLVDQFCHACGQNSHYTRLEMGQVLSEVFQSLISFDSRFLRTFTGLTVRPGGVCRDYVEGKRQRYTNPATYFVAAFTFSFVMMSLLESLWPAPASSDDVQLTGSYAILTGYLAIMPLALIWRWQFRESGYNMLENYVLLLFLLGHVAVFEAIFLPLLRPLARWHLDLALFLTAMYGYFVLAGLSFYRQSLQRVALKILLSFVFWLIAAAPILLLVDWLVLQSKS
jgi:hypothetical protein